MVSKVSKICFTKKTGDEMLDVSSVEVIANKGILDDRYFKDNNDKDIQITLIEKENIDYFNLKANTNIPYIDFRRNIITQGVELNELVGEIILVGNIKLKCHRLCDPCKYLQDKLKEKNLFKTLANLHKRGGLRCEILTNGKISINDEIKKI